MARKGRGFFRRGSSVEAEPSVEWPRGTTELDERSYPDFVRAYPLVAIEFWAPWCAPCKTMRPIIRDLATKYRGVLAIGKVNTGNHPSIAHGLDVMTVPYLVFLSRGKRVDELRGSVTKRRLEGKFKALAAKYGR
jgi:thiol-disulfide isomerase/thioredoxin